MTEFKTLWPHVNLTHYHSHGYERLVCSDGEMVGYADVPILEDMAVSWLGVYFDCMKEGWRQAKEMLAIEPVVKPTGNATVEDAPVAWTELAGS